MDRSEELMTNRIAARSSLPPSQSSLLLQHTRCTLRHGLRTCSPPPFEHTVLQKCHCKKLWSVISRNECSHEQSLPFPSSILKKHLCPSAMAISMWEHPICKAKLPSCTSSAERAFKVNSKLSCPQSQVYWQKACISLKQFSHPTIKDQKNTKHGGTTADSFHSPLPTLPILLVSSLFTKHQQDAASQNLCDSVRHRPWKRDTDPGRFFSYLLPLIAN